MRKKSRSFLLLQGPVGPFFKELGSALESRGHSVKKVNFWGGDKAFYPDGIAYTASFSQWSNFFLKVCSKHAVTDVVLFGDRRPYHEVAIEVISQANPEARVWVFEEGYFRPNWVTLDHYGVNARSSLPKTADELLASVDRLTDLRDPGGKTVLPWIREFSPVCLRYYLSGFLSSGSFPHFRYHRPQSPIQEVWGWCRSFIEGVAGQNTDGELAEFKALKEEGVRHFVVPLQLESDYQMRKYSPFKKNEDFIEYLIKSFAKFSRPSDTLVVKSHPYDYGWVNWKSVVARLSEKYGLSGRVFFLHKCSLSDVLDDCSGCVTINSTFGLAALESGVPVKCMGQVFWNTDFLTTKAVLDHFWEHPNPVDPDAFKLFKQYVMSSTQFNGGFYSAQGRSLLVGGVAEELISGEQDTKRLSEEPRERLIEKRKKKTVANRPIPTLRQKLDMTL